MTLTSMVEMSQMSTDRMIDPDDDLYDIIKTFEDDKDQGIEVPILLTPSLKIVDGLRRVEAARRFGYNGPLPAKVIDDLEEAVEYIKQTTSGNLSQIRIVEMFLDLDELTESYHFKERSKVIIKAAEDGEKIRGLKPWKGRRKLFVEQLGLSASRLSEAAQFVRMWNYLYTDQERAVYMAVRRTLLAGNNYFIGARNELLRQVPQLYSRYSADYHIDPRTLTNSLRLQLTGTRPDGSKPLKTLEVIKILDNGINALEGVLAALKELSLNQPIDHPEIADLAKRYRSATRLITSISTSLNKMERSK